MFSSPYRVWASLTQLATIGRQKCWAETVVTPFNITSDRYNSVPGVSVVVDGDQENSVRGFDYLDYFKEKRDSCPHFSTSSGTEGNALLRNDSSCPKHSTSSSGTEGNAPLRSGGEWAASIGVPETKYFHEMIKAFESVGYVDKVNLAGRPFDWRLPLWQLIYKGSEWAEKTQRTVEELYKKNNNKKVVIIAHSLGTLMTVYFLNTVVDQQWKDQYVDSFVSIGGVYGGSFKVVKALLSGYNDPVSFDLWNVVNISLVSAEILRDVHRSMGSMYSLAPSPHVFGQDFVVATVPRNITNSSTNSWSKWWSDAKRAWNRWWNPSFPDIIQEMDVYTTSNWTLALPPQHTTMLQNAFKHMHNITRTDPKVPVYCFWGNFDKPTTDNRYLYDSPQMDQPPSIVYGEGDDTVPLQSLKYCTRWKSTVLSHEFANLDHMFIFGNTDFNRFIVSLVTGREPDEAVRQTNTTDSSDSYSFENSPKESSQTDYSLEI
eukprot:GHVS01092594.1.p1 GENE.GHVS01092594.1~~GHVS01092594.1.p1  ORF type:complete len:549 (+),score=73.89 GHVS01092594.1:185-1648(+)